MNVAKLRTILDTNPDFAPLFVTAVVVVSIVVLLILERRRG